MSPSTTFPSIPLGILVAKEWRSVLSSPKLAATAATASLLVLLAIGLGLREHRAFAEAQAAGRELHAEELAEVASWHEVATRVFRPADPLAVFVTGVHYDVGRAARVAPRAEPELRHGVYADDPLLAFFRTFDLAFLVTVVLSLFAVVFTYDAVSGEREAGTLRLALAHPLPRARFVVAKLVGLGSAFAAPLVVALLLGLLATALAGVDLATGDLARLAVLAGGSLAYLAFFVAVGVAVSALTRHPATSFLCLLALWTALVVVVPRLGLLAAVRLVPVPTEAELAARRAGFESRAFQEHARDVERRWAERGAESAGLAPEEREAYEAERLWAWLEEDDEASRALDDEVAANAERLAAEARLRRREQTRLALALSRLSPASVYQLLAVQLAGTGPELARRYEEALRTYRDELRRWVDAASGGGGNRIVLRRRAGDAGGAAGVDDRREDVPLDEMPRFVPPRPTTREALATAPGDLALLGLATLLATTVAVVAFLRYDVR